MYKYISRDVDGVSFVTNLEENIGLLLARIREAGFFRSGSGREAQVKKQRIKRFLWARQWLMLTCEEPSIF